MEILILMGFFGVCLCLLAAVGVAVWRLVRKRRRRVR